MDVFDKFLQEFSYKFEKGYPDMDNPHDRELLFSLANNLIKEEVDNSKTEEKVKPTFNKQELIDFINNIEDEDLLKKIFKAVKAAGHVESLDHYLSTKNLTDKDVNYFITLLQNMDKIGEFSALAQNPPNFDLNKSNYYEQIPGFTSEELKGLFMDMKDSIKGTVSLGPGENFLSVFFGNISKEGKKGDLNIDGKEIELKSRIGAAGAVVSPRIYNRGDFSTQIKPHTEKLIKSLGLESNQEGEILALNVPRVGGPWVKKIDLFYKKFLEFGGEQSKFLQEFEKMLKQMYHTLNFNVKEYFNNDSFDPAKFSISIAKKLAEEYYKIEKFDGLIFSDPNGNYQYYEGGKFIDEIGGKIHVSYLSDLVPRLKI